MEILGILMMNSLMKSIPHAEVGDTKYQDISEAFFTFFKVIVYWLKFGYNYQTRGSM